MKFKTRTIFPKELPQFLRLFQTVLHEDFPEYQPKIAATYRAYFSEKYFKKFLKKKTNAILGVFDNDKIIASLVLNDQDAGVLEFFWLFVDKKYRNKGIASALLKTGEEWALKNKFHHVLFHTENMRLVEFYKKRGYEYIGLQRKLYFGSDEHLMQKVLREEPFEEIFEKYLKNK